MFASDSATVPHVMPPTVPPVMPRVASLLPSATEIVCALGLRDHLVLRSHECDHPPGVETLPFATEPGYDVDGSSRAVDDRLRALLEAGLGVFRVDVEVLREAAPEVILTQDQCQVCAVPLSAIEEAACALLDPAPRIVSLSPSTVDQVLDTFAAVGEALGRPERGGELRAQVQQRMDRVREAVAAVAAIDPAPPRPRVLTIEWFDPLMPAGNWVPELVAMAGGENVMGEAGGHSPVVAWEAMAATAPDVIVLLPCGFDVERALAEVHLLDALPGWSELEAVRAGRVAVADGNRYFNRPGPRLADSLEILAEILHPEAVSFGHAGDGWCWVSPPPPGDGLVAGADRP